MVRATRQGKAQAHGLLALHTPENLKLALSQGFTCE